MVSIVSPTDVGVESIKMDPDVIKKLPVGSCYITLTGDALKHLKQVDGEHGGRTTPYMIKLQQGQTVKLRFEPLLVGYNNGNDTWNIVADDGAKEITCLTGHEKNWNFGLLSNVSSPNVVRYGEVGGKVTTTARCFQREQVSTESQIIGYAIDTGIPLTPALGSVIVKNEKNEWVLPVKCVTLNQTEQAVAQKLEKTLADDRRKAKLINDYGKKIAALDSEGTDIQKKIRDWLDEQIGIEQAEVESCTKRAGDLAAKVRKGKGKDTTDAANKMKAEAADWRQYALNHEGRLNDLKAQRKALDAVKQLPKVHCKTKQDVCWVPLSCCRAS